MNGVYSDGRLIAMGLALMVEAIIVAKYEISIPLPLHV